MALERNTLFQKTDSVLDFIFAKTKVAGDKTRRAILLMDISAPEIR